MVNPRRGVVPCGMKGSCAISKTSRIFLTKERILSSNEVDSHPEIGKVRLPGGVENGSHRWSAFTDVAGELDRGLADCVDACC
jgi:hypothetical protein